MTLLGEMNVQLIGTLCVNVGAIGVGELNQKAICELRGELEGFLREFHAGLTSDPLERDSLADGGSLWARPGSGAFILEQSEFERYGQLLRYAIETIAPDGDLSVAAIDSALKDAIFAIGEQHGASANVLDCAIAEAADAFIRFASTPENVHECWVEIEGVNPSSLPASFGLTKFEVLGESHFNELKEIVSSDSVDPKVKLEMVSQFARTRTGSVVAIQSVSARDMAGALHVARREIGLTIESINCFADLIPFNSARLKIAHGKPDTGSSIKFSKSQDGSFLISPDYKTPFNLDMQRLREIEGFSGDARARVDELLSTHPRSRVQELMLRSVRWLGRAVAAETSEDGLLNSVIALECLTLPKKLESKIASTFSRRVARILDENGSKYERLVKDVKRLYNIRSRLVHDGSLEVSENDRAYCQSMAMAAVFTVITRSDIETIDSLEKLDEILRSD